MSPFKGAILLNKASDWADRLTGRLKLYTMRRLVDLQHLDEDNSQLLTLGPVFPIQWKYYNIGIYRIFTKGESGDGY